MIRSSLKWDGERVKQSVIEAGWDSIRRVTVWFWQRVQDTLSVPNPGTRVTIKRGKNKGKTKTVYLYPSKPGEPPRVRTGNLKKNVLYEFDQAALRSRVGLTAQAIYGAFLELAKSRRRRREWLLVTLKKNLQLMRQIASGGE